MVRILVLDDAVHGLPVSEYVDALSEGLPEATVVHPRTTADTIQAASDAEVITGLFLPEEVLSAATELRLFAAVSAGYDHLPLGRLNEMEITVTNASGVHGPNIAEHVIGWLLMSVRGLDEGLRRQERSEWHHFQTDGELRGSTVTIVGLGAVGTAITNRLDPFGVETIGVRYTPEKGGPTDEVCGFEEIESALVRTDYLVLACPLTEMTRGLIDTDALNALSAESMLVNVSRGEVVDTDALVRVIRRGQLGGAALDVTDPEPLPQDHPLWNFQNVYITPHVAGYTPEYWSRRADILSRNLERVQESGSWTDLENQVLP
ncbi:D-2-hydroxyacid dehydrogenase [Halobellus rubicundus]|uniref:D-2-hydroxyacid dehydrogenase n=1 Tax=Halobellus rubicundus TaxID=2996466 RepID=A0ABD5MF52_9EURY